MKYFIDLEFIDNGVSKLFPISIGIVAEDGRTYYAVYTTQQFVRELPGPNADWLRQNVFPHIPLGAGKFDFHIAEEILNFVKDDTPKFWGYYCDYDWVLFCQTFGGMLKLPKAWPKFCLDVKQWAEMVGNPKLPHKPHVEHNALSDAEAIRLNYYWLEANYPQCEPCKKGIPRIYEPFLKGYVHKYLNCNGPCKGPDGWAG